MNALPVMVKREFWEHRSLWVTPLGLGAVLLFSTVFFGRFRLDIFGGLPDTAFSNSGPLALFQLGLIGIFVPFEIAAAILAAAYLLDCLYADRRDRSILFWKSMPVSDTATVLVKFLVGLVLVPLLSFAVAALTSVLVAALLAVRLTLFTSAAAQTNAVPLWDTWTWLSTQGGMLYELVAGLLWYAPYAAYLLLVSAWARRSVYAWAFIPPVLLALLERLVFGTHLIGRLVQQGYDEALRLAFRINQQIDINIGGPRNMGPPRERFLPPAPDPSQLLSDPHLWFGLVLAALLVWGAVLLRRYRDDS